MKLSAELCRIESKISDGVQAFGSRATIKPSVFILHFYSPDGVLSLEISEQSKFAEHLALFRSVNGKNASFIFDIGGENVENYFLDKISEYKAEKIEIYGKLS